MLTPQIDSDEEEFLEAAEQIKNKKASMKLVSQQKNRLQNKAVIPRKKKHVSLTEFANGMRKHGHDPSVLQKRAARKTEELRSKWEAAEARDQAAHEAASSSMDVDMDGPAPSAMSSKSKRIAARAPKTNRLTDGLATEGQADKANELRNFAQREPNRLAKASESDRHVPITRPKWMLAGKRKAGKTQRR